jgi:hypothetical protein
MIPGHEGILGVILGPVDNRSQIYPIISYKITRVLNLFMFKSKIMRSANAAKATASGLLLGQLDEKAYNAYQKLAQEILERYEQNHQWEQERNKLAEKALADLKKDPANKGMSDEQLRELLIEEYSAGHLWKMPRNTQYRSEESSDDTNEETSAGNESAADNRSGAE